MDLKSTLRLPKTDFPMRGDLAKREPDQLRAWDESRLYERILATRAKAPRFVLHDGPPYANGHIHYGHVLNKVLKDIVVKYRTLAGARAVFVPGWDCHGLPIELQVERDAGPSKQSMSKVEFRRECRAYAERFVDVQRGEFRRLGVFARWDRPYLTMDFAYEASIVRELGRLARGGYLTRGKRVVHWCVSCRTALAEAEVEYAEHTSPSIYVKFPLRGGGERLHAELRGRSVAFVVWTTTPWTLPANLAIALGPKIRYVAVEVGEDALIVAADRLEEVARKCRLGAPPIICEIDPAKAEKAVTRHPLLPRDSIVLLADFVDTASGSGCVHIAPGHGAEDFALGRRHGLEPFAPIDEAGCFTAEVERYQGLHVDQANPIIVKDLQEASALLNRVGDTIAHSYPHCWRCKTPVLFRATPQWFARLDHADLRRRALDAIDRTRWLPPWGRDRIHGMVATRPDWCLSRQRAWGVPIPAFYCEGCGMELLDADVVDHVAAIFAEVGADAWFERKAGALLPPGTRCRGCGAANFRHEQDIVDVWFESGVSWAAVCEGQPDLWPIDLYLEGSDQHRGWFHSSLLASVATREKAPYAAVLTHGFVVDEVTGEPYSKSARNFIPTDQIIGKYGAEILRVWVAYVDYRNDMPFGPKVLEQLGETYRKLRNTWRFLLGNLADFDPARDAVPASQIAGFDRYVLSRLRTHADTARRAYEEYDFQKVLQTLVYLASVELSSLYVDVRKDRLYCDAAAAPERRATQTVLWLAARALAIMGSPILAFTAEEVWRHLPRRPGDPESVHMALWPSSTELPEADAGLESEWSGLLTLRDEVNRAMEPFRAQKHSSLDARVIITADGERRALLARHADALAELLIVSQVTIEEGKGGVRVEAADGTRCPRCWKFTTNGRADEPCARCAAVLGAGT
ncbi:MAG: isoleucine--tRNA ligase [Myxococcota bacterium]